jgi:hypothetical protein
MKYFLYGFSLILLMFFTACGSSGGGSGTGVTQTEVEGKVLRNTLTNSNSAIVVFADANKNGKLDSGENTAEADADGNYKLSAPNVASTPIGAQVSTVSDIQAADYYYLFTPAGETVISPLTTVVHSKVADGVALDAAKDELQSGIGGDVDFFDTDAEMTLVVTKAAQYLANNLKKVADAEAVPNADLNTTLANLINAFLAVLADVIADLTADPNATLPDIEFDVAIEVKTIPAADFFKTPVKLYALEYDDGEYKLSSLDVSSSGYSMFVDGLSELQRDHEWPHTLDGNGTVEQLTNKFVEVLEEPVSTLTANPNFGQTITFSQSAIKYTLVHAAPKPETISYLKSLGISGPVPNSIGEIHSCAQLVGNKITDGCGNNWGTLTLNATNSTFTWAPSNRYSEYDPFKTDIILNRTGTYTVTGSGNGIEYTFKATDGSVFYYYYGNYPKYGYSNWTFVIYLADDDNAILFNEAGAIDIREQWDTTLTP